MSCSGDGLTVGDVVGFSLTSQVKDKGGVIDKNAFVGLFRLVDDKEIPIFTGSMSTYTVQNGILSFTAEDIISFTDNEYTMYIDENESGKSGGLKLPIGEQYKAAQALLTAYSGMGVTIPSTGAENFYTSETGWGIRELFSKCGIWDGKNYYVNHNNSSLTSQVIVSGFGNFVTSKKSEHSEVSVSSTDIKINCVQVSDKDNFSSVLLINGLTYEDYGIYRFMEGQPTPSGTRSFVCPFITKLNKDFCGAKSILGYSNGCSFNCDNVLFSSLQPPYTRINFTELGDSQPAFYIMQANYRLSGEGLIASISGTTKSISDAEFIGQTQKDLQKRIMLDVSYGYVSVNIREGIVWDDTDVEEKNSSDEEENNDSENKEEKEENESSNNEEENKNNNSSSETEK